MATKNIPIPLEELKRVVKDNAEEYVVNFGCCVWAKPFALELPALPEGVASCTISRTSTKSSIGTTGIIATAGSTAQSITVYYGDVLSISATADTGYEDPTATLSATTVTGDVTASITAGSAPIKLFYPASDGSSILNTDYKITKNGSDFIVMPSSEGIAYVEPGDELVIYYYYSGSYFRSTSFAAIGEVNNGYVSSKSSYSLTVGTKDVAAIVGYDGYEETHSEITYGISQSYSTYTLYYPARGSSLVSSSNPKYKVERTSSPKAKASTGVLVEHPSSQGTLTIYEGDVLKIYYATSSSGSYSQYTGYAALAPLYGSSLYEEDFVTSITVNRDVAVYVDASVQYHSSLSFIPESEDEDICPECGLTGYHYCACCQEFHYAEDGCSGPEPEPEVTCSECGKTGYHYCSCGEYHYADEACPEPEPEPEVTCPECGKTGYHHCTYCWEYHEAEDGCPDSAFGVCSVCGERKPLVEFESDKGDGTICSECFENGYV